MNKKIVFRTEDNKIFHCIVSGEKDLDQQLNRLFYGEEHPKHGICVHLSDDTLDFIDYYHAERMGYHHVIRIEDTDEEVSTTLFNE